MSEGPKVAYHRAMRSNWKSIAKHGLLPSGGDTVNSGRAYVYLSEKKYGTDGYPSGLRGKCPVEIKVALAQAVEGGVIFRRSAMDGIMTAERIPSQYIISITADDRMLWNRAESNLEPSTWERAADPVTSGSGVELVPRDDGDPADVAMDDTSRGQPDVLPAASADSADTQVYNDHPPVRVRRVYVAPKSAEPFTGDCPLCMVEYVSGQITCTTCGYEPLPVDESGQVKRQANRRTKVLEKRMMKLAEFGMFGKTNAALLATLTGEQADVLRRELGPRGITSLESFVLRGSRDRYKRAKQLGYENVEDRYACDESFCDRVQDGRGLADCIFDDMMAFALRTCQTRFAPGPKYRLASPPMPKMPTVSPS